MKDVKVVKSSNNKQGLPRKNDMQMQFPFMGRVGGLSASKQEDIRMMSKKEVHKQMVQDKKIKKNLFLSLRGMQVRQIIKRW